MKPLLRLLFLLVATIVASTSFTHAADVGDTVGAMKSDGHFYLGTVMAFRGSGEAQVRFNVSGEKEWVKPKELRVVRNRDFKNGERVFAASSGPRMYLGTVVARKGDSYMVAWNDKKGAELIPAMRMIPKP